MKKEEQTPETKPAPSGVGVEPLVVPVCICSSWVREPELTDGILTNHHPRCPKFEGKKKYFRISLDGGGSYVQPIDQLHTAMDGEIDGAPIGTKWTIELIEMFEEQYDGLPEFAGH